MIQWGMVRGLTRPLSLRNSAKHPYSSPPLPPLPTVTPIVPTGITMSMPIPLSHRRNVYAAYPNYFISRDTVFVSPADDFRPRVLRLTIFSNRLTNVIIRVVFFVTLSIVRDYDVRGIPIYSVFEIKFNCVIKIGK